MNDCPHAHVELDVQGRVWFIGGEIMDSQVEHWFCSDCGATVPAPEPEPVDQALLAELPF